MNRVRFGLAVIYGLIVLGFFYLSLTVREIANGGGGTILYVGFMLALGLVFIMASLASGGKSAEEQLPIESAG